MNWAIHAIAFSFAMTVTNLALADEPEDCGLAITKPSYALPLNRAMQLREAGKLNDAEVEVKKVLTASPNNPRALYSMGMILLERERLSEAAATMTKAVDVHDRCGAASGPLNSNIHNNIGYTNVLLGQYGSAAKSFETALKAADLPPSSRTKALSNLGYVYFLTGDFESAKPVLADAVTQHSSNAAYTLNLIKRVEAAKERASP